MKTKKEFGPSQSAQMLHGLRIAAEKLQRHEFKKIVAPASMQLRFKFMSE